MRSSETICAAASVSAIGAASTIAFIKGFAARPHWAMTLNFYAVTVALIAGLWLVITLFKIRRSSSPARDLVAAFKPVWMRDAASLMALAAFLVSMSWIKSMLPAFWADPALARIDRAIFGGSLVIELPIIPQAYLLWQLVNMGIPAWIIFQPESDDKSDKLLSYVLTWTIGMALAYAVSSSGPVFNGAIALDPFVKKEVAYLWANYEASGAAMAGGISAFPSMHVAIAGWFALSYRNPLTLVFLGLICVGAVTLGWHYSSDVVGGLLVAVIAHRLAKTRLTWRAPARLASS